MAIRGFELGSLVSLAPVLVGSPLMISMNKYVFPGADASLPLGWVISKVSYRAPDRHWWFEADVQLESANFEIKSVDVLGVHYSATIHRWYLNWVSNKDAVVEKYGIRWYRIWVYFLAYSVM
jgi:cyclopropane fatty-acyl-phospholipid synthase-like methyltransferase